MGFTTADLLNSIKKRGLIPSNQITYQDVDMLNLANEELQLNIVPMIMSFRQDYFSVSQDQAFVGGQKNYPIPQRAIGQKLRDAVWVDGQGDSHNLVRFQLDEISSIFQGDQPGTPYGFYFEGNDVVVWPTPNVPGTLRLFYFLRRNNLVSLAEVATIGAIDTVLKTVTVNAVPSTFSVGSLCDLVQANPGFGLTAMDSAITSIASTTIGFAMLPSNLAVGDYVCLAQQTVVPQIPVELHPVLAQMVLIKILEGLNAPGAQNSQAKLNEMIKNVKMLLSDRVEGEATKITSGGYDLGNLIRRGY